MEITEVRVRLVNGKTDKLRAFCSITLDNDFVVRDLKVIDGGRGAFVAMPSRKVTERCRRCGGRNHYRAQFCNDCGGRLREERAAPEDASTKFHTDVAHPINSRCREAIQKRVLEAYEAEKKKSAEPGYRPMHFDVFDEASLVEETESVIGEIEAGAISPDLDGGPSDDSALPDAGPAGEVARSGSRGRGDLRRQEPRRDGRDGGRNRGRDRGRGRDRDRGRRSDGPRQEGDRRGPRGGFRDRRDGGDPAREGRGGERTPEGRAMPLPVAPVADRSSEPPRPSRVEVSRLPPETAPPAREPARAEPAAEPEDNFGAGLFN